MANFTSLIFEPLPDPFMSVNMLTYSFSFGQAFWPGDFFPDDPPSTGADSLSFQDDSIPREVLVLLGTDFVSAGGTYTGHATEIRLYPYYGVAPAPGGGLTGVQQTTFLKDINVDLALVFAAMATASAADDVALLRSLLSGNDTIELERWNDVGFGGSGNDVLKGFGGDDDLYGDGGNDTLIGGEGSDAMSGGSGLDTASYETAASAVTAALDGSSGGVGDASGDFFIGIEGLTGSRFADTLTGNIRANVLTGGDGSDTLWGKGGDDTLNGGAGRDLLHGGRGADTINVGTGFDRVIYENAAERSDKIIGFAADDQFLFKSSAFGNLDLGTIDDRIFISGTTNAAGDVNDRFIFRTTDYTLWFDIDGTGTAAAVMMADLQSAYLLQSEQIFIIA